MKKPVPNLCAASGISRDFRSAYRNLTHYLERIEAGEPPRTRFLAMRSFLHRPIPRYEEHFDPAQYNDVMNPANEAAIARINQIVGRLNALRESASADYKTLTSLRAELEDVISGETLAGGAD